MNTYGRGNPDVERVIAEMNALNAVMKAMLQSPSLSQEAQDMVRVVERQWPTPRTVSEFTIRAAMARITGSGNPVGDPTPEGSVWATRSFELVALAWLAWSRNDPERARAQLAQWDHEVGRRDEGLSEQGAIEMFAVSFWASAIKALTEHQIDAAKMYFRRVYEVGSNFGTESHPTVLWTFAASFFTPEG